jgi:hypothetical protein
VVGFRGYAQRDPLQEYKTEGLHPVRIHAGAAAPDRFVLGALAAASLATPLWQATAHAATRKKKRKKARRSNYTPMPREALDQGEPFHLVVSIREQKAHVYAGTQLIGSSRISSGKPGHDTPQGIFTVMEKRRHHRSNIYSNAPMPYMQRLTWSGIALHEGHVPNRPASHGCIPLAAQLRRGPVQH